MLSGPSGLDDNTSGDSGLRGELASNSAKPVKPSRDGSGSDADAKRAYVDAIYAAYPVKRLPENAKQAIGNAIKREAKSRKVRWSEAAEHILARTKAYAASEYVRSRMAAGHTVKHPKPWFDGGGYDEPDEEWARTWRVDGQRDGPSEGAGGGTGGGGGGGKPRTDYDAIEKNLLAKERVA